MKIKTFEQLMEKLGGEVQAAALLDVHQMTVESWRRRKTGIPHKYWDAIMRKAKVSAEEMHAINTDLHTR